MTMTISTQGDGPSITKKKNRKNEVTNLCETKVYKTKLRLQTRLHYKIAEQGTGNAKLML